MGSSGFNSEIEKRQTTMNIFLNNIPAKTKNNELYDFVVEKTGSWQLKNIGHEIFRCVVVRITDEESKQITHHGLITVKNPDVGERVIEKLHGQLFKGAEIEVREYYPRVPGDQRFEDECLDISRPEDRRRDSLKIER